SYSDGLGDVLVLPVDGDDAFGRRHGESGGGRFHRGDLCRPGLFNRHGPEIDGDVTSFDRVGRHTVLAVAGLVGADKVAVLRGVDTLVVVPGGEVSDHVLGADAADL